MTIDEVTGGKIKIGNTTYHMVEAKYNGTVVWPLAQPVVTTYVVVASSVYYIFSNSGNILLASGSNYAEAYGNVLVQEDGVTVDTLYGVRLDVALPSGSPFRIDNNRVFGYNLGGNVTSTQESIINVTYMTSATTSASTKLYQEANVESTTTVEGSKIYGQSETTYSDYGISFSANRYYTQQSKCPANGGSASLSLSAWHTEAVMTPWTRTDTTTHSFTSGYEYTSTATYSGTEQTGGGQVADTPVITGSAIWASRSGLNVSIASYATQSVYWDEGRSVTYTATVTKHDNTTLTQTVTLYQDADSVASQSTSTEREWAASPNPAVNDNYQVTLTISRYTHQTSGDECPAGGDFAGIVLGGSHHEIITKDYTDVTTTTYNWVSGRTTTDITTQSGTATISDQTVTGDVPTLTIPVAWLTYDSQLSRLVFDSEGTTSLSSGRNATVTATNGSASTSVTVYQERNIRSAIFEYNMSVDIQSEGATLPGTAGRYAVVYVSEYALYYRYTSGAETAKNFNPYNATVRTNANCTPDEGVGTVSGTGMFYINVTQNPSTSQSRTIEVWLDGASSDSPHGTIQQDAYVAPVLKVATFIPQMFSVNTGPYLRGKVYYLFTIDSGSVTSSTITGVNFCYRVNGGTKNTVQIGSFSVSETSQPTALEPSGVTIPTFSSGTVKAWFEVTGLTGDFDVINADESNYSTEITF